MIFILIFETKWFMLCLSIFLQYFMKGLNVEKLLIAVSVPEKSTSTTSIII